MSSMRRGWVRTRTSVQFFSGTGWLPKRVPRPRGAVLPAGPSQQARHGRKLQAPAAPLARSDEPDLSTPTESVVAYRGPSLARVGTAGSPEVRSFPAAREARDIPGLSFF